VLRLIYNSMKVYSALILSLMLNYYDYIQWREPYAG
jgi:hypothetical protein